MAQSISVATAELFEHLVSCNRSGMVTQSQFARALSQPGGTGGHAFQDIRSYMTIFCDQPSCISMEEALAYMQGEGRKDLGPVGAVCYDG